MDCLLDRANLELHTVGMVLSRQMEPQKEQAQGEDYMIASLTQKCQPGQLWQKLAVFSLEPPDP